MGQTCQDDTRTELSKPGEPGLTTMMVEKGIQIASIAQLVSTLDFNFERAVEGSILTAGKRLSLKNLNVIIRAIN